MKAPIITAILAAASMAVVAQPAAACPNGYESIWIQGNRVCKVKTPKLDLKAKQGFEPAAAKKATIKAGPARR